ncbi:hypothetical protein GmHk_06G017229 [Glycine max]|nr:hypothetical protein GmHk_06G017229 [Glycine max]
MDEDEWMYESIMSEEADMDYQDEEACGANEPHVFDSRDDVLRWARSVAHENIFVAVIIRSDTNTSSRGRTSFVLIGCDRSGEYRCRKKEFIRRDTGTRKCGCPFKLHRKPVVGGEGWMVKLIYGVHNHELAKSLVGHPYAGRLTKAEKTLIVDMTKSMVKPRNILLTLKEHNANSCTTIKQIYNARSAFCSSIKESDLEMQHLMKLLERDQYIHWHKIKDEDGCLTDYPSERQFDECLKKFKMAYSPWPMFVDYIIPHKEKFVSAWTNKVIHLGNTTTNRYENVDGIVLLYMFIVIVICVFGMYLELECVDYAGKNPSSCGCMVRTTLGLPCSCELSKYVGGCIPLDSIHMFWRRLSFSDQGLCEPEVSIKAEIETISKRFEELDVCGKFILKTKLWEIAYPN